MDPVALPRQVTNLLVLASVIGLAASGLVAWLLPLERAAPLYDLHRALAAALVLLLVWKQVIVRASLRRRLRPPRFDRSVLVGMAAGLALAAALGVGIAWTLGAVTFDSIAGYSALNVHVFVGLGLVPLVLLHLARRWQRLPPVARLLSRRTLLRAGVASLASLALWRATEAVAAARRVTGSKHAGSFTGNAFPYTIWAFDEAPSVDVSSWRLEVAGVPVSYDELIALPRHELAAVLDCTGGWWTEQRWRGVRVADVLDRYASGASPREVRVVSVTGHAWSFGLDEVRDALLATHVGGEPLAPGHGFPVRLVAPGRRGFQWVKWVARLELS